MIIDLYKRSNNNNGSPSAGVALRIVIGKNNKGQQCQLTLSEEAKSVLTKTHAAVLFDTDTNIMTIKPAEKGQGYKLQKTAPQARFTLPKILHAEIGQTANAAIEIQKDSITFDWPFKDAQNITKLQSDKEKTIEQAAARAVTPQTQTQALKSDSTQQKKTVTQEQVIEILRNTSHAMTASEIADRLNLTNSDNRMDVNKRLHRLHSSKKVLVIKNQWARNTYKINPDYEKATRKPAQTQGIYAPEPSKKEDKNQVILELIKNTGHAVSLDELTAKSPYNYGTCHNAINKLIQQRKIMMTNRKPVMVKVA